MPPSLITEDCVGRVRRVFLRRNPTFSGLAVWFVGLRYANPTYNYNG